MAQTLEESVLRILQSPEVSRINFRLLGVDVRGTGYSGIADKILEGSITVEEDPALPPGKAAKFSPKPTEKFSFLNHRYGFREWHSYVVHEATHALVYLQKIHLSAEEDESVALTAQAVYFRRAGFGFKSHFITNPRIFVARDIADLIIQGRDVPDSLVEKLKTAIRG